MTDWYRKKTWTSIDEEEFFTKLNRARKDGRAQYLKIQAIELVVTKDPILLDVAESLIQKLFINDPEDIIHRSSCLKTLGDIYKYKQQFNQAVEFYIQAVDFEKIHSNVVTQAYLEYAELVVKHRMQNHYDIVEQTVSKRIKGSIIFPIELYKAFSILSCISNYNGYYENAEQYAALANKYASAETSGLRYHKYLGIAT